MSQPLELLIHGARGSFPGGGVAQLRHGVRTVCVEVELAPDHRLIVDCGTGLVESTPAGPAPRFDVFLTHFHLDHVIGLPFFPPLYDPRARFTFYAASHEGHDVRSALEAILRPPFFPVALADTASAKTFVDIGDHAGFDCGGVRVTHAAVRHPQGVTAYRLEGRGLSALIATDYERGDAASDARLERLGAGAELVLHDAQYTPEEFDAKRGWGHSTFDQAIDTAEAVGAKRLVLFHHDPRRTDDGLESILARARERFPGTVAAMDGMRVR